MFVSVKERLSVGAAVVLLFFFLFFLQNQIILYRGLPQQLLVKPGEFALLVALGGLKAVAADLLFLKANEFWQEGKWEEMLPLYRAITMLQPNYIDYWSLAGAHLAWNLPFNAKTKEEKEKYIRQGIKFLKEGILYNADVYKLYFSLAFIYDHRVNDYDEAIKWYKKAVSFPGHPTYIDREVAHSLRKKGDLKAAHEEWLRLKGQYEDDEYHQEMVRLNLKFIEEEIRKNEASQK